MGDAARRHALQTMNSHYGYHLERIPEQDWPPMPLLRHKLVEVWRSHQYLLMVWRQDGYERLSVCKAELVSGGRYRDGISWDVLQQLKAECGRGDRWACEIYPAEGHVVNVQNMRHLFILDEPPPYGWRKGDEAWSS